MSMSATGGTAGGWTSNATIAGIAGFLRGKSRVVVTTHVKPDGDAVGSTLAAVRALNLSSGGASRAEAWYFGPMPPWLSEVAKDTPHRVLGPEGVPAGADPDAVLVVDTGSRQQLEALRGFLEGRAGTTAIVDHHVQGDGDLAHLRHIDTGAAAACQPIAALCKEVLGVRGATGLPAEVATLLYLGLATDTGWFRHSNVDRSVMVLAGELIEAKAEHIWLYQTVEQRETVSRLRLLSRALASLEVVEDGKVAVMSLRLKDFSESRAEPGESGGFVDYGQAIAGVQVTVLLTEANPGEYGEAGSGVVTKVSLRSKPGAGSVDVNAVAKELGGGGHVRASGARIARSIEESRVGVVRAIRKHAPWGGA